MGDQLTSLNNSIKHKKKLEQLLKKLIKHVKKMIDNLGNCFLHLYLSEFSSQAYKTGHELGTAQPQLVITLYCQNEKTWLNTF